MPVGISRKRTAELLENRHDDFWSHFIDIGLVFLIIANVVCVVLESVDSLTLAYYPWFLGFEIFSVVIFTLEYILRVWSALELPEYDRLGPVRGRLRYMVSGYALIDFVAILPFYLGVFFTGMDWRFLRVVRLLRLFKLTRYSIAMQALLQSLQAESESLVAAFFLLFVLFVLASSGIYLIERDMQPDAFGSIPAAMWWAMATLTTVGYGDVVPVTVWGKIFGGVITVIGVGMVALPAGIIASGFSEHLREQRTSSDDLLSTVLDEQAPLHARKLAATTLGNTMNLREQTIARLLHTAQVEPLPAPSQAPAESDQKLAGPLE